jgi:ADP-heptose:LPS heptosyltransferase/glycosyltransferase involved in cell wall biosynthesis
VTDRPQSILYIRPDTIGDIVIFQPALARLQAAWPNARHTVVVRPGYEALAPLFPHNLHWQVASVNPFKHRPSQCKGELDALCEQLERLVPDLILAPALNRTWLEAAIAARFPKVRSVVLGNRAVDPIFESAVKIDIGVDSAKAFGEVVPIVEGERDWENQHRFVDHLLARRGIHAAPSVVVPQAAVEKAGRILSDLKLATGDWAAVFPAGLANVSVKSWQPAHFGELGEWLQETRKLPVLLLGHESETSVLEEVASAMVQKGAQAPRRWLGRDGELPLLAALLQRARLYVGHDTGAMHLSAAVGRPTVGIFGGGHWPRFRPVGERTVSIVQPLPCFGCNWDCQFGNGPCVKTLAVDDVRKGVDKVLAGPAGRLEEVVEVRNLSEDALRLIADVTPRHAALQRDRLERQHKIEELKDEADFKDVEIATLKQTAEDRKAESDAKDLEITDLKKETDLKDAEIDDLKRETNNKDVEIGDLKRAAEERKVESDTKDAEIVALKETCNEREALIIKQDGHIKNFQKIVAGLDAVRAEKERQLAESEAARLAAEGILAKLPQDAATWADAFAARDTHVRNLDAIIVARDGEIAGLRLAIAEKDAALANFRAGWESLEMAKHYGRLLTEKEAAIQTLHTACVEREAIIRQLAAESTRPTAWMRKLGLATSAFVRERLWRPFDTWLFREVVEKYWMQIGILRHYDPRPLAWDRRLARNYRLPDDRLPRIGLVTPCFQQATFIESTMLSVLNQAYPKLLYVVRDGGSQDDSPGIIARYAGRLHYWESARDAGQGDAIRQGFAHISSELGPEDLMAWLNSDDLIAPRALRFVAEYFATHPDADVIYGHRIIIDGDDREVGRWIMPRHDREALEWIDYVPQETLFWRKRAWDLAGGIDTSFQFALDWDLLARFQRAGCRIERVPYFLGCFRLHAGQKTSQVIHTTGAEEMGRIRARFHPGREQDFAAINAHARKTRFRGALVARLLNAGIRW